jgi:hypothetical protein
LVGQDQRRKMFDTVLLLSGEDSLLFDRLCQRITRSILAIFVQMMEDRGCLKAHRVQSTYHKRFLDYLYTGVDAALAEVATTNPELGCRMTLKESDRWLQQSEQTLIRISVSCKYESYWLFDMPSS